MDDCNNSKKQKLEKLERDYQKSVKSLQKPEFNEKVKKMVAAQGKFTRPTKLGPPR